jgi:hypothetical protein
MQAFYLCADGFAQLAQQLDGRGAPFTSIKNSASNSVEQQSAEQSAEEMKARNAAADEAAS